ncbi:MAG: GtrA family protein [bacterium]|nr:GtrA family protein [bacterium]
MNRTSERIGLLKKERAMFVEKLLQRSAVRFVCAGLVGFSTYYALLYVLTECAGWWYLASAMSALIVDYAITFVLQKILTFGDRTTHVLGRQIGQYALMNAGFYVSNSILLFVLVDGIGMWYMAAQVLISILLTAVSFPISRRMFNP